MSRDIFVQDMPSELTDASEFPDDFAPAPLPLTGAQVRGAIVALFPSATFTGEWGRLEADGVSMELSVGDDEPLLSFAIHDRSSDWDAAARIITRILDELGVRAFDPSEPGSVFLPVR